MIPLAAAFLALVALTAYTVRRLDAAEERWVQETDEPVEVGDA